MYYKDTGYGYNYYWALVRESAIEFVRLANVSILKIRNIIRGIASMQGYFADHFRTGGYSHWDKNP